MIGVRRGEFTSQLGSGFPGTSIAQLALPSACVAVFGEARRSAAVATPIDAISGELVRLNLFAELQGLQTHVSSSWIRAGQRGLVALVTGLQADQWWVYAQAQYPTTSVRATIQALEGCGSFSVQIPTEFRGIGSAFEDGTPTWITLPPGLVQAPLEPLLVEGGAWDVQSITGPGALVVPLGWRVQRIQLDSGAPGVVTLTSAQAPPRTITLPAFGQRILEPRGALVGPCTFTAPAGVDVLLELTR